MLQDVQVNPSGAPHSSHALRSAVEQEFLEAVIYKEVEGSGLSRLCSDLWNANMNWYPNFSEMQALILLFYTES